MSEQLELVPVPAPASRHPGRCRLPTRSGSAKPCRRTAEGTVAEWTAPLDPAQRLGSCQECADAYRLTWVPF